MSELENAIKIMSDGEYTCVMCRGEAVYTSTERGVKPLLAALASGQELRGASAADKVVGRAAAFLYVLIGVSRVYAEVMSETAISVFERYGVEHSCRERTQTIYNRTLTGLCPMESAVLDITQPEEAKTAIEKKLAELRSGSRE